MPCRNCGYPTSVVSSDKDGFWLCEWRSNNELKNPLRELIKKGIKELPECSSKECMGCEWDLVRNKLQKLLEDSQKSESHICETKEKE